MAVIFGFDIGTTSIGFAVIDHDPKGADGRILRLGVRIFPEARDVDGTPLNQQRRQKRMARRQHRRRRQRRRLLNESLTAAGLLPAFDSQDWQEVMRSDPYELRKRALETALAPHEVGRAIYHLAQRRHFRGRELLEEAEEQAEDDEEKVARNESELTLQLLRNEGITLGAWLERRGPHVRKRGVHAHRLAVEAEFDELWAAQAKHHEVLRDDTFKGEVRNIIFTQRPVFWRKNTLGQCRFVPTDPLCPKGAWLSQQRRMLEQLNNLSVAGANIRPLDNEERAAILEKLQARPALTWTQVRSALKPLYAARGEAGAERSLKFNLELGGSSRLLGNSTEAKLRTIFGPEWAIHPHKQAIREAVYQRLWSADYEEIGQQRIVIVSEGERKQRRARAAQSFMVDFDVTQAQAQELEKLTFPPGWEPFSEAALRAFLPKLEEGIRFGDLLNSPEWEAWRAEAFPNRVNPSSCVRARLPSPKDKEEQERLAKVRNPTVVRTQNELRKVVNNLIDMFGKPDLIRVELAREVGKSKREREEIQAAMRKRERRRKEAIKDLESKGIVEPSRDTVDKWILWKESQERCPYTGDQISFDALFRENRYEVEHIWPRSRCFDNSLANKTLCRKDINIDKGQRTPFEYLGHDPERWAAIKTRLDGMIATKGGFGITRRKAERFVAEALPDDFANRQLNDTSYAAREIAAHLKRLWPEPDVATSARVQVVSGRVTAQLRRLWELNSILADDGEKTRADHRHHAIDALVVACAGPGITSKLSRYWQAFDDPRARRPVLSPPWPAIRADAEKAVGQIVVSHRVQKKVSGPLHKETIYGDTGEDVTTKRITYRWFVTRKSVTSLSKGDLECIRDEEVRRILKEWVTARGGDPKKAFPPYPRLGENGPEIRKVRVRIKQQLDLMAQVSTGYADRGANHHIAIYRQPGGKVDFEVVSLFEAARRLSRREPIVRRTRDDVGAFVMSLSPGEAIRFENGAMTGIWIVKGAWANGQVVLARHTDATRASETRPSPSAILRAGGHKVSIDPIGRIRPAYD